MPINALLLCCCAALALLWLGWLAWLGGPGRAGERRVARVLRRHCSEVHNDIILPDDHGGLTQIDHLALVPAGVLVVETKTLNGQVFGSAAESHWTQWIGRRRLRFQNPLRQNFAHLQAVRALAPGVAVHGLVVFAGGARFPKGMPPGVYSLRELPAALQALQGTSGGPPPQAWHRLCAAMRTDGATRRAHLALLRARHRDRAAGPAEGAPPWHAPLPGTGHLRIPILVAGSVLGLALVAWLLWPSLPFLTRPAAPVPGGDRVLPTMVGAASSPTLPGPAPSAAKPAAPVPGRAPGLSPADSGRPLPTLPSPAPAPATGPAGIHWAGQGEESDACALATARVLVQRDVASQRYRDFVCGQRESADQQ